MNSIVSTLTISAVREYLENTGWYIGAKWRRPVTVWYLEGNDSAQIILPDSKDILDYDAAMTRVLEELVDVEQRSAQDIVLSIDKKEKINIRIIADDVEFGEIPIIDGVSLFQGACELIKATAEDLFKSSKTETKTKRVDDYIRSVTFGQTEIGSYSVNIYGPKISSENINQNDYLDSASFMSVAILSSLEKLKESLDEYAKSNDIMVLNKIQYRETYAKLCSALLDMSGKESRKVEINADKNSGTSKDSKKSKIAFDGEYFPKIKDALSYFKGSYHLKQREVVGKITKLSRDDGQSDGQITIRAFIGEKLRSINITLNERDYEHALKIHGKQQNVLFVGDIEVQTRSARMTNISRFDPVISQAKIDG